MHKGTIIFLDETDLNEKVNHTNINDFDESDFKLNHKDILNADFIIFSHSKTGEQKVLKNRYGTNGKIAAEGLRLIDIFG
jgi:hypothetical protein